jgi:hypothetical protein
MPMLLLVASIHETTELRQPETALPNEFTTYSHFMFNIRSTLGILRF